MDNIKEIKECQAQLYKLIMAEDHTIEEQVLMYELNELINKLPAYIGLEV